MNDSVIRVTVSCALSVLELGSNLSLSLCSVSIRYKQVSHSVHLYYITDTVNKYFNKSLFTKITIYKKMNKQKTSPIHTIYDSNKNCSSLN